MIVSCPNWRRGSLVALCTLAAALPGFAPAGAASSAAGVSQASATAGCQSIRFGSRGFVFFRDNIRCRKAKRLARKVRREKRLDGWNCSSGTNFTTGAYCKRRGGRAVFGWHPGD